MRHFTDAIFEEINAEFQNNNKNLFPQSALRHRATRTELEA